MRLFERLGPAEIDERRRMADRLLVGEGASYTNDESDEASQAWRIDPVPLLWPRATGRRSKPAWPNAPASSTPSSPTSTGRSAC